MTILTLSSICGAGIIVFTMIAFIFECKKTRKYGLHIIGIPYSIFINISRDMVKRNIVIMIGKTLFNIGNAALFFSMSGFLVSTLGISEGDLTKLLYYGIVLTVAGYLASLLEKFERKTAI